VSLECSSGAVGFPQQDVRQSNLGILLIADGPCRLIRCSARISCCAAAATDESPKAGQVSCLSVGVTVDPAIRLSKGIRAQEMPFGR
jgi:hypothetical protein